MEINIRFYSDADAPHIAKLEKECFADPWSQNAIAEAAKYGTIEIRMPDKPYDGSKIVIRDIQKEEQLISCFERFSYSGLHGVRCMCIHLPRQTKSRTVYTKYKTEGFGIG